MAIDRVIFRGHRIPPEHPAERKGDHPDPRLNDPFFKAELRTRWIAEHPGSDYEAWKQNAENTRLADRPNEFDIWAETVGRDLAESNEQSRLDFLVTDSIRNAELPERMAKYAGYTDPLFAWQPLAKETYGLLKIRMDASAQVAGTEANVESAQGAGTEANVDRERKEREERLERLEAANRSSREASRYLHLFTHTVGAVADEALAATAAEQLTLKDGASARKTYGDAFRELVGEVYKWQLLVAQKSVPDPVQMCDCIKSFMDKLDKLMEVHADVVKLVKGRDGGCPKTVELDVPARLSALSAEIARQFAGRLADGQVSVMFERTGEDPRRDTDPTSWSDAINVAEGENPELLPPMILGALKNAATDPGQPQEAQDLLRTFINDKSVPDLDAAMVAWQQAFDPSNSDPHRLSIMSRAVNDIMFTLTFYRDGIELAKLDTKTALGCLAPIDALQMHLQNRLKRFLLQPAPGSVVRT